MKKKLLLVAIGFALTTQMIIAQVPSYVPTNGLVGYWPFSGNANDVSANGNNGIVTGATLTTDRFGNASKAYLFNNNYITIPYSNVFDFTDYTLSLWVSTSQTTIGVAVKQLNYTNASNERFVMGINNPSSTALFAAKYNSPNCVAGDGWQYNAVVQPIFNNQYHHLVGTVSGGTTKLYVDGILVNTIVTPYTKSSLCFGGDVQIGRDWANYLHYFIGKIDDVGIWNRALTPDEIISLYQAEVSCQSLVINSGTLSSFKLAVYQSTITIYPNPANDQITIDCGNLDKVSGWNIKIYNTLSQEVFSGAMNQQQYTIPLNTWGGKGVYFVKIYDDSNNLMNTKKIILQ